MRNQNSPIGGNITFSTKECGAGLGGWNCTYPSVKLATNSSISVANNKWSYAYWDIMSQTGPDVEINVTMAGNGTVYLRKDGYPEYLQIEGKIFTSSALPKMFFSSIFTHILFRRYAANVL